MLLPAADLSIAIAGLALQDLFAKAVKGVLLVFGVAIRFHVLTSLRAGRQFFSSPFAHYSFCGRLFWPALPGKIKIIFSVAHLCVPFVLIGWVAGSGKGRSAGTIEASPITTKSACLQNADRRRRIIKSIYMISVFILIAGIVRWRGYAFFSWCKSWTLRKSKKDTENNLPSATVPLQVVIGLCKRKETAALKIKAAASNRRVDWLLYDGFFSFAVAQQSKLTVYLLTV